MSLFNHFKQKKKLVVEAFAASFMVAFVCAVILPRVFAVTAYYFPDVAVELDGTSDKSVTISLNSPIEDNLFSIQGTFDTADTGGNFTLTSLNPAAGMVPSSNEVVDGVILWQVSYTSPFAIGERASMWTATYDVDKDTLAGDYSLCLKGARISSESNDYDTPSYGNLCAKVTVTRNVTPAEKLPQTLVLRDGEGNDITGTTIEKYYGDEPFTVIIERPVGDGAISFHPDDDEAGEHVARTSGSNVEIDNVGSVDVCAWADETEEYAGAQACITVNVSRRPLDIVSATIADKTFDGTMDATVTNVTFEDKNLSNDQYTATANFDDANVGDNKTLHVNVSLTADAAKNYVLNAQVFNTTATILPYHLVREDVELLGGGSYSYSPNGVEPEVRVTANTHGGISTLSEENYEVSYSNNTNVGTGHVTVTGKGNYTTGDNPVTIDFTIVARGINNDNLTVPNSIVEGRILTVDDVSVSIDGHELVRCANVDDNNCDYVLEISGDNDGVIGHSVHVGITACNNYDGVAVADVNIVAKLEQTVTIADVTNTTVDKSYGDADFTYTATTNGDGGISYRSTNESVATVDNSGKVTVVGVGDADIVATAAETDTHAGGSAKYTLHVAKKEITVTGATVANKNYDGSTVATVSNVSLSENSLSYNTDFTATASFNGVDAAVRNADVTVTLSDDAFANYCFVHEESCIKTAQYTATAAITSFPLDASNTTVVLSETEYTYDGTAKEPGATVTVDFDGDSVRETTLTAGVDYTATYNNNVNAGTASVKIAGKGNYAGSLAEIDFTINPAPVENVVVSAPAQKYTGSALQPVPTVTGTVGGALMTLTENDFEIVNHESFINANSYTFAITSKSGSNYAIPETNGTFEIEKAESGDPTESVSNLSGEVAKTLADLGNLPEGFAWADPTTPITAGMNNYPATYTKNGDTANYVSIEVEIPVLGFTEEYEVVKGDGQEHIIGVDGAAEFEIDADYELFEDGGVVYVDNVLVEPTNYESWSSSTVISLTGEYLDSLAVGEHTLAALFNDGGVARASFNVVEPDAAPEAANTGVFTSVAGGAVATGSAISVFAVLISSLYILNK